MMKKIFLYKNALPCMLKPVETGLLVVCLCLLAGSCNKDIIQGDDDGGEVAALQFSTAVDEMLPGSKSEYAGNVADNIGGLALTTKPLYGLPIGSELGMFIRSTAGVDVHPGSGDNMKATITSGEEWIYAKKDGTPIDTLKGMVNKKIKLIAYYPWNSAASDTSVPFDFTASMPLVQTDFLYNVPEKQTHRITAGGRVELEFGHAYSCVTLEIVKSDPNVIVTIESVGIINQLKDYIKNKGSINPTTGEVNAAGLQTGDIISAGHTDALSADIKTEYNFFVPPFMSGDVRDDHIAIMVSLKQGNAPGTEVKTCIYPLKRANLNEVPAGSKNYGFAKGYKNTYEVVYNTDAMAITVLNWNAVSAGASVGDRLLPSAGYKEWVLDYDKINDMAPVITDAGTELAAPLESAKHPYEGYLLDSERRNNGRDNGWLPDYPDPFSYMWTLEPPVSPIMFALKDAIDRPVYWRTPDGILFAKQLCRNYRENGYTNWRLPRISEWYMLDRMVQKHHDFIDKPTYDSNIGTALGRFPYWSGTQMRFADHYEVIYCWLVKSLDPFAFKMKCGTFPPENLARVRCVRDSDKATPKSPISN